METAPLKSFATWARTALIREVTARIAVVLAPASPERVEQPKAVEALEKAVNAAGGGDKGKAAVADRVAYTWFNRIIALRFMDANGYTGIGVVSPQAGVEGGQPEILAEAKRGNIDAAVVGAKTRETVTALLNGTRRSDDAQGEAYALLLADYCRHWNRAMPFMFEREGDFTELLIPANLLADDSVPSRAVKVLTKDVCQDVEVIGWLYQFYISERKDEVFAGFKKNKKAGADEIPAATQLFTPHWIVRYLVENSLGRLWMLNRPSSRLVDQMEYYIAPVDEETDFLKIGSPEELKVIDPACGSGHMLTYAFDLLYAIYEEEGYAPAEIPGLILANNLYGMEIDPRAGALAAFALTMKARAKQRTFFNKQVEPNVCVLEPIYFTPEELDFLVTRGSNRTAEEAFWNQFEHADIFGSLIRPDGRLVETLSEQTDPSVATDTDLFARDLVARVRRVLDHAAYLTARYHVVVANPPYMGNGSMGGELSTWIKAEYAAGKQDLYGAFVLRALTLARPTGLVAMITGDSWMTIKTFADFRDELLGSHAFHTFLHLRDSNYHADTFGANAAFVLANCHTKSTRCVFVRLEPVETEAKRVCLVEALRDPSSPWSYEVRPNDFLAIPGSPFAYQLSDHMRGAFARGKPLTAIAEPRQGLATSDNNRFLKQWWEPSRAALGFDMPTRDAALKSGKRWFPCQKGGPFRKWYGNHSLVVDWWNDGEEMLAFATKLYRSPTRTVKNIPYYFRPGATWSSATSGAFSMRYSPAGFISETKGSICYAEPRRAKWVLGLGNSPVMASFLAALSPTLDYHEGPVGRVPVESEPPDWVLELVDNAIGLARVDWDEQESSWDFERDPLVACGLSNLAAAWTTTRERWQDRVVDLQRIEEEINRFFIADYGVESEVEARVPLERISLNANPAFIYPDGDIPEREARLKADSVRDLISYAVGCMFGRYSLDEPGFILGDQGATVRDYLANVPSPTFMPDKDNVLPIVDGDWFEDDIVERFRQFLRAAFGEQYFEDNLRFLTESLAVHDIRDYFVKSFYKDHVQRYKKRPIYWLFSSPKGSFNALIYMHRYTPSTVSTVLNEYLREFTAKLSSSLQQQERLAVAGGTPRQQAAAQKEADRLRKVLLELEEYEHDVLYPLASRQLAIDLDDGVKANYPKFGAALKRIAGLEASE